MSDLVSFSLMAFSAVFFVIDPIGLVPIFLALTAGDSPEKRRRTAMRASTVSLGMLIAFTLGGSLIFRAFGITLGAFKVAGGILLLLMALDMLRAQPSRTRSTPEETSEGSTKDDVAIVPLAIPLIAGPGAIATVMVLTARAKSWVYTVPVLGAVVLTCAITFLLLRVAPALNRILGHTGLAVLERIMGLLVAAIAVQFMADGITDLLPGRIP